MSVPGHILRATVFEQLGWLARQPGGLRLSQIAPGPASDGQRRWVIELDQGDRGAWGHSLKEAVHHLLLELEADARPRVA